MKAKDILKKIIADFWSNSWGNIRVTKMERISMFI